MCVEKRAILRSSVIGLLLTLLTYFMYNSVIVGEFPYIMLASEPMVGAGYWGYPLPWVKQIVYPGAVKQVIWSHFVLNIAYWSVLVLIVDTIYRRTLRAKGVVEKAEMRRLERALKARSRRAKKTAKRKTVRSARTSRRR